MTEWSVDKGEVRKRAEAYTCSSFNLYAFFKTHVGVF